MKHAPPELLHRLKAHGQEHVLEGWDALSAAERVQLLAQLAGIDFGELEQLLRRKGEPHTLLPPREAIAPIPVEPVEASVDARAAGEELLRRGEVAALCVAGGQGSRLGFDKPKGLFPFGPVSNASLFQLHAEKVLALSRRHGCPVPLLVMTSPATDEETQSFFKKQRFFGLEEAQVTFFEQGTMPALDLAEGRLLLEKPGQLFLSPNGHGGTLTALADTGLLADFKQRGVKHLYYFQVDNALVKICDPAFLGRHHLANADVSSKVVMKERPEEKVGVLAVVNGRCSIVEYSDMPLAMAEEREPDGRLRFRAGSPAIHAFSLPFLERVTARGSGLQFHLARKKVPFFDARTGSTVEPEEVNALKFELFIFDALPMADNWLAVATPREEEFAPLKNATGNDSPETARALSTALHARWLAAAGIETQGHAVEIAPTFALDADELRTKISPTFTVTKPTYLR